MGTYMAGGSISPAQAGDGFIDFQEFKKLLEHPQLQAAG